MPESPECRRTAEELNDLLCGKQLTDIAVRSGRYHRHDEPDGLSKLKTCFPVRVEKVDVKGKFIWFELSNGVSIWNTLGMSGRWTLDSTKHSHVSFQADDTTIYFDDVRNFGTLKVCFDGKELKKKLKSLGPDILDAKTTLEDLDERLKLDKLKKKTIVEALMNQTIISGVGNYIKAEALFEARISPHRLCKSLSEDDRRRICEAVVSIAKQSYDSCGVSIRDYISPTGNKGTFKLKVYGKTGKGVVSEATNDGRTTYWMPEIQK